LRLLRASVYYTLSIIVKSYQQKFLIYFAKLNYFGTNLNFFLIGLKSLWWHLSYWAGAQVEACATKVNVGCVLRTVILQQLLKDQGGHIGMVLGVSKEYERPAPIRPPGLRLTATGTAGHIG
jgi:hypothetical protein